MTIVEKVKLFVYPETNVLLLPINLVIDVCKNMCFS